MNQASVNQGRKDEMPFHHPYSGHEDEVTNQRAAGAPTARSKLGTNRSTSGMIMEGFASPNVDLDTSKYHYLL